jgi:hypothetical protein
MTAAPTPTPGVVARWTTRRRPGAGAVCEECSTVLTDLECDECGQLAGPLVGMLATVVHTTAGARLVIAERTDNGWAPVRTLPATSDAVRALARPGATGPDLDRIPGAGGLW